MHNEKEEKTGGVNVGAQKAMLITLWTTKLQMNLPFSYSLLICIWLIANNKQRKDFKALSYFWSIQCVT